MSKTRTIWDRDSSDRRPSSSPSHTAQQKENGFRGIGRTIRESANCPIPGHVPEATIYQERRQRGREHRRATADRSPSGFVPEFLRRRSDGSLSVETASDPQPSEFFIRRRDSSACIREDNQMIREERERHHRRRLAMLCSFPRQGRDNFSQEQSDHGQLARSDFVRLFLRTQSWQSEQARWEAEESNRRVQDLSREYGILSDDENGHHMRRTSRSISNFPDNHSSETHIADVANELGSMVLEDSGTQFQPLETDRDEDIRNRTLTQAHDHFDQIERLLSATPTNGFIYHHRRHHEHASQGQMFSLQSRNNNESFDPDQYIPPPAHGASTAEINHLPQIEVSKVDRGEELKATCPICLEDVPASMSVTVLPCGHWYHHECISEWLTENPSCALCRASINGKACRSNDRP